MIAVVEGEPRSNCVNGTMGKRKSGAAQAQRREHAVMGDTTESHDRPQSWHGGDRGDQELSARIDLRRQRFVFRWHAAHGIGNRGIDERQTVVGSCPVSPRCETEFYEGSVKKVTGEVAGKGAAGLIGATQTRRKTNDQEARASRAKGRNRSIMPRGLGCSPFLTKSNQAWASRTVVAWVW